MSTSVRPVSPRPYHEGLWHKESGTPQVEVEHVVRQRICKQWGTPTHCCFWIRSDPLSHGDDFAMSLDHKTLRG